MLCPADHTTPLHMDAEGLNALDSKGKSKLHYACEAGKDAECRSPLLQNCNPDTTQTGDNQTALFYAAMLALSGLFTFGHWVRGAYRFK